MFFTAERESFLDAVTRLSRIVSNKTSYPVLEGILISAEQGKITMVAYNLEVSLKKEIYARTTEDGDIVLSAKLLGDILRKLSGPTVEISTDEKMMCHIRCSSAVFDIMGMAAADFPEIPSFTDGKKISIKGETLMDMTNGTAFSVAGEENSRPILMGINVSVEKNMLKFVAIDGYRLAIRKMLLDNTPDCNFVISGRNIEEAIRLIKDSSEVIPIFVGSKMISFEIDGYKLIARLLDGEFVNYEKTIPAEYKQRIVVKVSDIIKIFDRISLLISNSFLTPVRCMIGEEQITFSCATTVGKITETYEIDLEGEPFEIGLSSRYLTEALKAVEDDMVQIKFDSAKQGVVISPLEGEDYMYMIMPMRLK